ncbi:VWA domain-containing protein [Pseudenhygromyxa sp. WMMC2535]|uniref:vWA domain-containing protein n=1 Tax=Pseudenhygromyxa sp. WMMC2535 TaxID=2712867 RepID=UPI0015950CA6|nr:vWA domain-containing protein [Pseudenhygromyxa sp. WMMC2535]NVB39537.1 VWA domain-containing protein [Pseudenhygromyxa sp. WMMC2535]
MLRHRPSLLLSMTTALGLCSTLSACDGDGSDDGITFAGGGGTEDEGADEAEADDDAALPDLPGEDQGEEESADDGPPTCSSTTAVAENVPPNVVLVLDKSRSMVLNTWDEDGDPQTPEVTRWHSLHQTVASIGAQYEQGMSLGLGLFPSTAATSAYDAACLVNATIEVPTALDNTAAMLAAIPAADDMALYGATPATAGIDAALAHLEALDDGRPAALILITDGAANCGADKLELARFDDYDEDLPLVVGAAWEDAGIPTYVIGIDIQETSEHPFTTPREKLDEVAVAGGVPRVDGEVAFYDAADAQSLMSALDEIAAAVSCSVELGQAPSGPDELVISIDGEVLPQLESCDEGDGWVYANADYTRIELCNAACEALHDSGEVEAEFTCPPQP